MIKKESLEFSQKSKQLLMYGIETKGPISFFLKFKKICTPKWNYETELRKIVIEIIIL